MPSSRRQISRDRAATARRSTARSAPASRAARSSNMRDCRGVASVQRLDAHRRARRRPRAPSRLVASTVTSGQRPQHCGRELTGVVEQVLAVVEHEEQLPHLEELDDALDRATCPGAAGSRARGDRPAPSAGRRRRRRARTPTRRRRSRAATSAATWSARRVLPTPPTPVSVTSGASPSASATRPPRRRGRRTT